MSHSDSLRPPMVVREPLPGVVAAIAQLPSKPSHVIALMDGGMRSRVAIGVERPEARACGFGACGVSEVIDLSMPEGWYRLRQILADAGEELPARIRGFLDPVLADASPGTRAFFETMVRLAPRTPTIREFARTLRIHPGTLTSRFFRRGFGAGTFPSSPTG